jgi:hypothetical protein
MLIGTSYFPSRKAAKQYYVYEQATYPDIDRKIAEGLIHIGLPPCQRGQRIVLIDNGTRYAVEEQ